MPDPSSRATAALTTVGCDDLARTPLVACAGSVVDDLPLALLVDARDPHSAVELSQLRLREPAVVGPQSSDPFFVGLGLRGLFLLGLAALGLEFRIDHLGLRQRGR